MLQWKTRGACCIVVWLVFLLGKISFINSFSISAGVGKSIQHRNGALSNRKILRNPFLLQMSDKGDGGGGGKVSSDTNLYMIDDNKNDHVDVVIIGKRWRW